MTLKAHSLSLVFPECASNVHLHVTEYRKKLPFVNAAPIEEIEAKKLKPAGGKVKKSGRNRYRRLLNIRVFNPLDRFVGHLS
ncbi:hypothetical protein DPMN_154362 [Dreissena polymorpha]|uniref:Uncharacterized protein n=1 Tax=Dreissena polymorpha TaxID=45954 RepID=A0A9D4JAA5_DREPO|nr:hypothetical protein DPMN_154362 [Dreissena polymorpha]